MRCFHSQECKHTFARERRTQEWRSCRVIMDIHTKGFVSRLLSHIASTTSFLILVAALCDLKGRYLPAHQDTRELCRLSPASDCRRRRRRRGAPQSQQLCLCSGAIHNGARAIKSALLNDNFVRALRCRPPRPPKQGILQTFRCYSFVTVVGH